ncbi:MAG: hypothetical protein MUC78_09925 [Bacteroidales bacterium]|jgi:hypothetical protein|nr:hypothetical protein [Bacteroidales bacterium]
MKRSVLFFTAILIAIHSVVNAQEDLSQRPGTFEILSRTDYTTADCGFSKAEVSANLEKIKEVVAVVMQNPVLSDIKGFNGRARIYTMSMTCKRNEWYGVPSRISFEFSSFFFSKEGKVVFNSIEPPEWSLYINDLIPGWADSHNTKYGYFTAPLKKETKDYGIDVYDKECWVIYDPERPPYWIPVTVGEALAAAKEELYNNSDAVALQYVKPMFEQEYAAIPESDHNKPAYFGGGLSRVSSTPGYGEQDSIFPAIMRVNPEYLDRSLPRSEIQFIWFRSVQNKQYMKQRLDECREYSKKGSGSGCDLGRFELSFGMTDIRNLAPLIGN